MSRLSGLLLTSCVLLCGLWVVGCPTVTPPDTPEETAPVAAFVGTPRTGTAPLQVQFTDQSVAGSSAISRREWAFGDGARSVEGNPVHVYQQPGLYAVSLTVTTAVGSDTKTETDYILVQAIVTGPTASFTASPVLGDAPLTVTFKDTSDSGTSAITQRAWVFGDGATGTGAQVQHTYAQAGVYSVSLTVTTEVGSDTASEADLIRVVVLPQAAFSVSATAIQTGATVEFTDESTPGSAEQITSWRWDFGDGATSTLRNPTHTYNAWGVFSVSLTITTSEGADTETKAALITVTSLPKVDFSATPVKANVNVSIAFKDLTDPGSATVTARRWNFGDGQESTSQNPSHSYAVGGKYDVSLVVTTSSGVYTELKSGYITVTAPPVADFVAAPLTLQVNTQAQFTDRSLAGSSPIIGWLWNFGDGATSTLQNPTHIYTGPGRYTVALTVKTADGADTETKSQYIEAVAPLVADFTVSDSIVDVGEEVEFTDMSTPSADPIDTWTWNFGDGSTSSLRSPKHTWAAAGSYTVTLTVRVGSASASASHVVTVHSLLAADFIANEVRPFVNTSVQFTDTSNPGSDAIASWAWDFGDGATSTAKNPSHGYAVPGVYTVSLKVSNGAGESTKQKIDYIQVFYPLNAAFTPLPAAAVVDEEVTFQNDSTIGRADASQVVWAWDFGDGSAIDTTENPTHAYTAYGLYDITLTVTTPEGADASTLEDYAVVITPPTATFSAPAAVLAGDDVQFTETSTPGLAAPEVNDDIVAWTWDFGDGSDGSVEQHPIHPFASTVASVTFTVTLTVESQLGFTDTTTQTITVCNAPTPDFRADTTQPWVGQEVEFTNITQPGCALTLDAIDWAWDFGDDAPVNTEQAPRHAFPAAGVYTVSLTASWTCCDGQLSGDEIKLKEDYIVVTVNPPVVDFAADNTAPWVDATVRFTNLTTPGCAENLDTIKWVWDFGDDSDIVTDRDPVHVYRHVGTYTVTLTAIWSCEGEVADAEVSKIKTDYIVVTVDPPNVDFKADKTQVFNTEAVTFTNLTDLGSAKTVNKLVWQFGDATSSFEDSPEHTYSAAGVYTVSLTAYWSDGEAFGAVTETKENYITVSYEPPVADFTPSTYSPGVAQIVWFENKSTRGFGEFSPDSFLWEFGDGLTSTQRHPYHAFATQGAYDVTLTVTTVVAGTPPVYQSDSITKPIYVDVKPPVANFGMSDNSPFRWETVEFTDLSDPGTGPITHWAWDFGGDGTSNAQYPYHRFDVPGTYTITLTVTTPSGTSSASQPLVVIAIWAHAEFDVDRKVVLAGHDTVTFTSQSSIDANASISTNQWFCWQRDFTYPWGAGQPNFLWDMGFGQPVWTTGPADGLDYPFWEASLYHGMLIVLGTSLYDPGDPYDPNNITHWTGGSVYKEDIIEARNPTPLDIFVEDTTAFGYTKTETQVYDGYRAYRLTMTSQKWRAASEVYPDVWQHSVAIIQPDNLSNDQVVLYLADGRYDDPIPETVDTNLAKFAQRSGSVVVALYGALNGPLVFSDFPVEQMTGDDIIAYGLKKYLDTGDTDWIPLFPMVRSAVRAMDLVEDFFSNPAAGGPWPSPMTPAGFIVAGGGNNGWATWLTAITDPRVKGIVPMAWDSLALQYQLDNQWEMLGYTSLFEAWAPYADVIDDLWFASEPTPYSWAERTFGYLFRMYRYIKWDRRTTSEDDDGNHFDALATLLEYPDDPAKWDVQAGVSGLNSPGLLDGQLDPDLALIGTRAECDSTTTAGSLGEQSIMKLLLCPDGEAEETTAVKIAKVLCDNTWLTGKVGRVLKDIRTAKSDLLDLKVTSGGEDMYLYRGGFLLWMIDPMYFGEKYTSRLQWWSMLGTRLRMPKLIINSTGDQYSMPNASKVSYPYLDNPKTLRYVPNTDRTLNGGYEATLLEAIPWYTETVSGHSAPYAAWEYTREGVMEITVVAAQKPASVTLWTAASRNCDFRYDPSVNYDVASGLPLPEWHPFNLDPSSESGGYIKYNVNIAPQLHDFTAYFVEFTYTDGQVQTTAVDIVWPTVPHQNVPPQARFVGAPRVQATDAPVIFTDQSSEGTSPISSWEWDFGDGMTSTLPNPEHAYALPGTYTVTLKVTADNGAGTVLSDTMERPDYITINAIPPVGGFTANPTEVLVGDTVTFTDESVPGEDESPIVSWFWDFGDGTTSTDQNPTHAYATGGTYDVSLTVTSASAGVDVALQVRCIHVSVVGGDMSQQLYDYIHTPDPAYAYDFVQGMSYSGTGYNAYVIRMTSQTWRDASEVDKPVWEHWLTIFAPTVTTNDAAMLLIDGGSNTATGPTDAYGDYIPNLAIMTGSPIVVLEQVPSEPLRFTDETRTRSEDAIIAYSYAKYVETYNDGDPDGSWPVLLAMAKSAVRAMDTVQDFLASDDASPAIDVNRFVVTGASKRGWTTWLTGAYDAQLAAADRRVIAIAPMVIDVLNMDEQMDHHRKAYGNYAPNSTKYHMYGGYSDSVKDYVEKGVFGGFYTPGGQALLSVVDPYEFRDVLTVPKFIINSTGDQFFLPDGAQFYYDDLLGEKYLNYLPNTDHGLGLAENPYNILNPLVAFYQGVVTGSGMPDFSWSYLDEETVKIETTATPSSVSLWQAHTEVSRDFRMENIGKVWQSTPISQTSPGVYVAQVSTPSTGWTGYMVQMTFPTVGLGGATYTFTTPIKVLPDIYPEPYGAR